MYDRESLLVKVAMMFYEEEITQTQISKELNISRPTIATLLKEAKDSGIVQITISHTNKEMYTIEKDLQLKYPNTNIHVAPQINGSSDPKISVGTSAARLLQTLIKNDSTIGLGWGTTTSEVVNSFEHMTLINSLIIPMIGGVGVSNAKIHSNHLVFELAQKTSGNVEYLYAPAVTDSEESKNNFVSNQYITSVMSKAKSVDIALFGIGNPISESNYVNLGYLTKNDYNELKKLGVVGDALTSFFGVDGQPINTSISNRMIGLTMADLKNIETTIAVATGTNKAKPISSILKTNLIDHLVIDEELALTLLNKEDNIEVKKNS